MSYGNQDYCQNWITEIGLPIGNITKIGLPIGSIAKIRFLISQHWEIGNPIGTDWDQSGVSLRSGFQILVSTSGGISATDRITRKSAKNANS